ncbi:MAG TPA: protein-L-isoaspartate(D-aspartate) O-methyltransferase [Kofleriaceae bacterium]|nr:protein-L-isoaspartate(D-aspartate) O-methyltransferase [Kofleriaceae bacterium]
MIRALALLIALGAACRAEKQAPPPEPATTPAARAAPAAGGEDAWAGRREAMVARTIEARGVRDPRVLAAMRRVPRHELVPAALRHRAYDDSPLPIGFDQTISQPYIVAAMTEAAGVAPGERVLEVGTGSGYQAAVLAELGADVYSIEIVEPLAKRTHALLAKLGYDKLHLRIGDGYRGWPEAAPFDAIVVTAAPAQVPQPLIDQLAEGGRLVIPVGRAGAQQLRVITRGPGGTTSETLFDVRFVPMTGEAQR